MVTLKKGFFRKSSREASQKIADSFFKTNALKILFFDIQIWNVR